LPCFYSPVYHNPAPPSFASLDYLDRTLKYLVIPSRCRGARRISPACRPIPCNVARGWGSAPMIGVFFSSLESLIQNAMRPRVPHLFAFRYFGRVSGLLLRRDSCLAQEQHHKLPFRRRTLFRVPFFTSDDRSLFFPDFWRRFTPSFAQGAGQ